MDFFWTIVLFVIGIVFMFVSYPTDTSIGVIGGILCFIALCIPIIKTSPKQCQPTALDVYRGNTELKITSVNGVPTDTVVVFKNK